METHVFFVLLLAISWISLHSAQSLPDLQKFNCRTFVPSAFNIEEMKGLWYEAGRAPVSEALACLNVTVPDNVDNGNLELDLEYIATYDGSNRAVKETIKFPWDEYASKGLFNVYYGSSEYPVVTYKVVFTDPSYLTIICGDVAISPVPLIKVLTRPREPDADTKNMLEKLLQQTKYKNFFMWSEQSPDKCNAADRPVIGLVLILAIAFVQSVISS